jgi:dimethylglycine dehydrogenase
LVNAAGMWAPQVSEVVGARLPSVPVEHQHVLMQAVPGHEIPRGSPCFRDTDNLVYGKDEAGGMLIGGYEQDPAARWIDGVPWQHGASPVESDMDRFAPLLEGAIRRFPLLARAGVIRLLCHPDAMTPDGNPLLGPMPGIPGFWVFGSKNGWERADHFEPGRRWRRSGADQRRFGWTKPPWFEQVGAEHAAFRDASGSST